MERGLIKFNGLIVGDRIFRVPSYQRHYSWEKEHWEDLWNDIFYLDLGRRHYFGAILLKSTGQLKSFGVKKFEIYEIIDGQQRLTTSLILLGTIISQLERIGDEETKKQLEDLKKDYLRYGEVYKMELLGDDDEFFKKYIIEGERYPDELLTQSRKRLKEAKQFFEGKIAQQLEGKDLSESRDFLLQLKEKIDNLEIISYPIENDVDAILMFETVNDRGKLLTNLEKTKSFLMHMAYLSEPDDLEDFFKEINQNFSNIFRWFMRIKGTEWGEYLEEDDIQRYHYICYEAGSNKKRYQKYLDDLKQHVRNNLYRKNKQECREYISSYVRDLSRAFYAMEELLTQKADDQLMALFKKFFILGRVANFYPLLIASWIRFKSNESVMRDILSLAEKIAFRVYAIGRRRADTAQPELFSLAYKVHKESLDAPSIINKMKEIANYYEDDSWFKLDLKSPMYGSVYSDDIKYLLFEYELFLRNRAREPLDIKMEEILGSEYTIEHIWPQDVSRLNLTEEQKKEHEECVNKLGNLTLASRSWNASYGNKPFTEKVGKYQNSLLRVQKQLSVFSNWGKEQIERRENDIIEFALERWKLN